MTQRILMALCLTACSVSFPLAVLADQNPATDGVPRLIAYQGTLELNGEAYPESTVDMVFRLYDGESGPEVWSESQTVPVYGGNFAVLFGSTSAASSNLLQTAVTNADDLYLEIELITANGTVPLTGRQRFVPVPYSLWTSTATNLKVSGAENDGSVAAMRVTNGSSTLLVDGDEIDSNTTLNLNVNSRQGVRLGGSTYLDGVDVIFDPDPGRGDGGRALVHGTSDSLVLNYAGDLSGGTSVQSGLSVQGNLSAQSSLTVSGNLVANSNTHGTCVWTSWFSEEKGSMFCASGEFVAGMECSGSYCDNVRLWCCKL